MNVRPRPRPTWMGSVGLLYLTGCIGVAAEHEALGDRAYAEGRFGEALIEYRLSVVQRASDAALHAKTAAAALNARELVTAAQEYIELTREGGAERLAEGADGLERVARAAVDRGDRQALAAAVDGLRQIAPDRALGTFALQLVREVGEGPPTREVLSALVFAAAAAPDARLLDSLIYSYAVVLRQLGRCEEAVPAFESLVRREREPVVVEGAREGGGFCTHALGQRALDEGLPLSAEKWFRKAAEGFGTTEYGRAAYLGLGEVLLARGDFPGAAAAYENALLGAEPGDSIAEAAVARLIILEMMGTGIP